MITWLMNVGIAAAVLGGLAIVAISIYFLVKLAVWVERRLHSDWYAIVIIISGLILIIGTLLTIVTSLK